MNMLRLCCGPHLCGRTVRRSRAMLTCSVSPGFWFWRELTRWFGQVFHSLLVQGLHAFLVVFPQMRGPFVAMLACKLLAKALLVWQKMALKEVGSSSRVQFFRQKISTCGEHSSVWQIHAAPNVTFCIELNLFHHQHFEAALTRHATCRHPQTPSGRALAAFLDRASLRSYWLRKMLMQQEAADGEEAPHELVSTEK